MPTPPLACPVCAAILLPGATIKHADWHEATGTLNGWTARDVARFISDNYDAVAALAGDEDAAETMRLPPIGETVRRRPPVPPPAEVRELRGADLLRALADELSRYDEAEDQGAEDPS